jgi:hypothetical protein
MALTVDQEDVAPDLVRPKSRKRRFMTEDDQRIEYVNALEKAQKLDDLLASLALRLKGTGSTLVDLGKRLEGAGPQPLDYSTRNFSRDCFDKIASDFADIPDLLDQYKTAHIERIELELSLNKFSWHRKGPK